MATSITTSFVNSGECLDEDTAINLGVDTQPLLVYRWEKHVLSVKKKVEGKDRLYQIAKLHSIGIRRNVKLLAGTTGASGYTKTGGRSCLVKMTVTHRCLI